MIRRYEEKQQQRSRGSSGAATDRGPGLGGGGGGAKGGGGAAAGAAAWAKAGKKVSAQDSSLRKWLFGAATDRGQTDETYGGIDGLDTRGTAAAAAKAQQERDLQLLSAQVRAVAYERDDVPLLGKGATPGSVTFKHSRDRKAQQREEGGGGGGGKCCECCCVVS